MAGHYIRIALLALCSLSVLMFTLGFVFGVKTKRTWQQAFTIVSVIMALLLAFIIFGLTRLPVSGALIVKQALSLWLEIGLAFGGGCECGLKIRSRQPKGAIVSVIPAVCFIGLLINSQISSVKPLLEDLQASGILKPRDDYKPETNKDCPANLQSLYSAFEQYADLNDKLPDAANWEDNTDLTSRIPQDEWLHCPAVSNRHDAKFGYAYNETLAGKKLNLNSKPLKSLPNAATTPLLYDSTNLDKNAHDAAQSLPRTGRHGGRNNILYLDGHVAPVAPK